MKTQIYAVTYFLRQTSRDFDSAFLLEELTDELLNPERSTYLLSPSAPNHYADIELATIKNFSAEAKANMLKLLLSLSQEPAKSAAISDFAARFLKSRQSHDLVVPSRLDYQQSDCNLLERDKAQKDFYPSYNADSFENLSLSKCLIAKKR